MSNPHDARDRRNAREATAAAWSHLACRKKTGHVGGTLTTVPLPDMQRNDLITLAAKKRIEAAALLTDIVFLEAIASGMTPGGLSVVNGVYTDDQLEALRRRCEARYGHRKPA